MLAGVVGLTLAVPCEPAFAQGLAQSERPPRWEVAGFDFRRDGGWRPRARRVAGQRAVLRRQGSMASLNAPLAAGQAPSAAAVTGTMRVPALLFAYQETSPADMRDSAQYGQLLFSATPLGTNPYTLRTYYEQMSNDLFSMQGRVMGWVRLAGLENSYTGQPGSCGGGNCNGIWSSAAIAAMHGGLREALAAVDGGIDFSEFDNDGPDLLPNSGDDDGYVDMIMFAHATEDGSCGGATNNHIWAHRFFLGATQEYVTDDARSGGGVIRVSDYFVQSALGGATSCAAGEIMAIGTAAHEFGHALGLPDLYDTEGPTEGIGRWGLMGSGNFSRPPSPARMEAWSLSELGWVTLRLVNTAGTYVVGPAPTADTTFLVNVQGANPRGEYFLLENRQAALADTALIANACLVWFQAPPPPSCGGGLLIWHVDGAKVDAWHATGQNNLNAGAIHGVALEEADGARDLWCPGAIPLACNRGDAGDPYPGQTANGAFSFNTAPRATKNADGSFPGFVINSIRQVVPGGEMAFRIRFGPVNTFLATADIVAHLLGPTAPLSAGDIGYLDAIGNQNAALDVGDFLAWLKTTGTPVSAEVMSRLAQPGRVP